MPRRLQRSTRRPGTVAQIRATCPGPMLKTSESGQFWTWGSCPRLAREAGGALDQGFDGSREAASGESDPVWILSNRVCTRCRQHHHHNRL